MAEQFLDAAQVGAVVEQVGGETVAQFVRGDMDWQTGFVPVLFDDVGDRLGGDAPAQLAQEERPLVNTGLETVALLPALRR